MKRATSLIALVVLSLGVSAQDRVQDSTMFDAMNRPNHVIDPLAHAFLRAYGTPSLGQIESHGWVQSAPSDLTSYKRVRLTGSTETPYSLLADYDRRLMFVVVGSGNDTRLYGPISFPRGV